MDSITDNIKELVFILLRTILALHLCNICIFLEMQTDA